MDLFKFMIMYGKKLRCPNILGKYSINVFEACFPSSHMNNVLHVEGDQPEYFSRF